MDHSYDLGLEARSEPKRAVSRSMRVVKQECNVGMPDGEKTLKPRKRALVAVRDANTTLAPCL